MNKQIDIRNVQQYYEKTLQELQDEMDLTDDLYEELKEHFDGIKKSSSPGALTFISKQTPNLIALRKNKIDLLTKQADITKNIIDSTIKLTADDDDEDSSMAILKEINRLLIENKSEEFIEKRLNSVDDTKNKISKEDNDDLLESRFASIEAENKSKEKRKKQKSKKNKKHKKYKFVVDIEGNIYPVDNEYNLLEDVEIPDDLSITIYEDDETGEIVALDDDGVEYEVIELDEE